MKNIYLICGPSGTGKSTLVEKLAQEHGMKAVCSYTTRPARAADEKGHIFVSDKEFDELCPMAAYTKFNGYRYGATEKQIDEADLFVLDPEGVSFMRKYYLGPKGIVVIGLTASELELRARMKKRGDSPEQIRRRLLHDRKVFAPSPSLCYDFQVHADGIEETVKAVYEFIQYREKYDASVKIYQINTDRDVQRRAFLGTVALKRLFGGNEIDRSLYDRMWEGRFTLTALDDVFTAFNADDRPNRRQMRSLSVSDIVEISDAADEALNGTWFCDSMSWKKLADGKTFECDTPILAAKADKIYTHDEAARIVDLFEAVLDRFGIRVPSPEDAERGDDNEAKLYGTVYGDLLDGVENALIELLNRQKGGADVESYVFSGN